MINSLFDSSYYVPHLFQLDPLHRPSRPTIDTIIGSFITYVFNLFTHNSMLDLSHSSRFNISLIVLGSILHVVLGIQYSLHK